MRARVRLAPIALTAAAVGAAALLGAGLSGGSGARAGAPAPASRVVVFPVDGGLRFADVVTQGSVHTRLPGSTWPVVPSPDGRLVVVGRATPGVDVVDARTGEVRARFDGLLDPWAATWSPDSTRLALYEGSRIAVADVRSEAVTTIVDEDGPPRGIAWDPTGETVAYGGSRGELLVADVASHRVTTLARGAHPADPSFSPDGRWLAYVDVDGTRDSVFVVPTGGGEPRALTAGVSDLSPSQVSHGFADAQRLAWSPDSRRIAFGSGYGGSIFVVGLDGWPARELTRHQGADESSNPVWSPDGRRVAYLRALPYQTGRVHVVDVDGRHDTPVLPDDPRAVPTTVHIVWAAGVAALPRPHGAAGTVSVTPTRELRFGWTVKQLGVDGGRAATIVGGTLQTWTPRTGATSSRRIPCDNDVFDPVIAVGRDAAICFEELNTRGFDQVSARGPGGRIDRTLEVERWSIEGDLNDKAADLDVAGGGSLIVALAGTSRSHVLWRLGPDGNVELRTYPRHVALLGVDGARVLLAVRPGRLEVVSADGSVLAAPTSPASEAVLRGPRIVARTGRQLTVRALDGRVLVRRALPAGSTLEDARGDLAVLVRADRLQLLRLSDGRSVTLRLPGQTGRAWARLDVSGLFYAYNGVGAKRGALGYVAAARLPELLAG